MWVDSTPNSHTYQEGLLTYTFDVYLFDLVYDDGSNEHLVLSDMTTVGLDFINELKNNYSTYGFWVNKNYGDQITFQQFTEQWDDKVSGIKFTMDISVPDDGGTCESVFSTIYVANQGKNSGFVVVPGTSGTSGENGTSGSSGVDGNFNAPPFLGEYLLCGHVA